jgi:thiamine transport system substrate-binding protein
VVLGLDTNLVAEARASGLFAEHGIEPPALDLPVAWDDPHFLPFDWGYFAFVHDRERTPEPPELVRGARRVGPVGGDPGPAELDAGARPPDVGEGGLWRRSAAAIWEALAPRVVTVTPGWSEAYGMFLAGEADMVLSYTTSPAYHVHEEDDDTKAAAIFEEGHYLQVEVAGITAGAAEPELAREFLAFMLDGAVAGGDADDELDVSGGDAGGGAA